ncbi:hypothetical protein JZ751_007978 [Albula glossodonta]|uniref:GP-PDE domain-containing protein n=1 Tax=Albula glossodonta TaxID=121402 RepID=A0A8T2P340_9TELE|nr:hypothetical protein JZ751_007978 [Albula glossodonta]
MSESHRVQAHNLLLCGRAPLMHPMTEASVSQQGSKKGFPNGRVSVRVQQARDPPQMQFSRHSLPLQRTWYYRETRSPLQLSQVHKATGPYLKCCRRPRAGQRIWTDVPTAAGNENQQSGKGVLALAQCCENAVRTLAVSWSLHVQDDTGRGQEREKGRSPVAHDEEALSVGGGGAEKLPPLISYRSQVMPKTNSTLPVQPRDLQEAETPPPPKDAAQHLSADMTSCLSLLKLSITPPAHLHQRSQGDWLNRADLDALPGQGRAGLDLPQAVPDGVQVEALGDLGGRRRRQQVLLVGEDQDRNATQLLLVQQLCQLLYLRRGDVADVLRRELFEEGGLAAIVQAQEQDPHLLVWGALQLTQDGQ